jgi:peptidoglycan/LPS O-acetylase OafA/YrhL
MAPPDPYDDPVLPTSARGRWLVGGVLAAALVLRLLVVWHERSAYFPQTDALQFDQLATSLARHHNFGPSLQPPMIGPSALRAPLYPLALGATYVVFGVHAFTAGLALNAVLGVVVVALSGLVASQLLGRRAGLAALVVAAFHPAMILTGTSLQLEPLLASLCLAALAAALQHRRAPGGLRWPLVAGVSLGLGVLTREQAFFFLLPVAWLVWTAGGHRPSWRDRSTLTGPILVIVAACLVVLPWTIRNAVQLHAFVPVTTSSGFGLVGTYNETSADSDTNPSMWLPPYNDPAASTVLLELRDPTEVRADAALRSAVVDFVRAHPAYPFRAAAWNIVRGLDLDGGDYTHLLAPYLPYPAWLLDPAIGAGWAVLLLAAIGATTRRARAVPWAVWAIPVTLFVFTIFFLPFSIRYRALMEPFLLLLVACTVVTAFDRVRAGFHPPEVTGTAPAPAPASTRSRPLVADPEAGVTPHDPAEGGHRAHNLDVLRAVAALMVLEGHAYNLSGLGIPLVATNLSEVLLNLSVTGVWLFFVISGYVISRSFVRALLADEDLPSIGRYAIRRVARLFPLYWLALVAAIVTVGREGARIWDLAAHVLLLHNLVPGEQLAILPAAWTLGLELLFYVSVPAAAIALARRRRSGGLTAQELAGWVVTVWIGSILWTVVADLVGNTDTGLWLRLLFPSLVSMFCPGILLAVAERAPAGTGLQRALVSMDRHRVALWFVAVGLVLLGGTAAWLDPVDGVRRYLLLYDAARVPFALGFGLAVALARRAPRWTSPPARALEKVGDWSYGVYLLQAVWFYAVLEPHPGLVPMARGGFDAYLVHAALLTALTVPSAWVTFRLVETPTMRLGARVARRWQPTPRAEPALVD